MLSVHSSLSARFYNVAEKLEQACVKDGIQKIVVGAVIRNDQDKVLIVKRASTEEFMAGLEEIPSGTVDPGEKVKDALHREVMEETGLKIKDVDDYLGSFDYLSKSKRITRQLNFSASVFDSRHVVLNPEEHDQFSWMNRDAVKVSGCSTHTKFVVERHFQNPKVTAPQKFPVELEGKSVDDLTF